MSPSETLFDQLIDDAALFPPGSAPMVRALPAHLERRDGPAAGLLGRFLCPASRLAEMSAGLDTVSPRPRRPVRLGVIADTGIEGLAEALARASSDERVRLEAVEIRADRADPRNSGGGRRVAARFASLRALLPPDVVCYLEVPPGDLDSLDAITVACADGARYGAKLRTGGPTAGDFPSVDAVARFLIACHEREIATKFTAGLHRAARHVDPESGLTHHGFLNILLAASRAVLGGDETELTATLCLESMTELGELVRTLDITTARATRNLVVGYGSCDIAEPVEDLMTLGLI